MSTRSSSSVSAPPRIADVLYRSLESAPALVSLAHARHDAEIALHRLNVPDDGALRLRIECRGLIQMPVRFAITRAGTPDYEVRCSVEDGPTRRFTYRLAGRGGTTLSRSPCLGRELATFLLGELERQIGQQLLQSASGPPSPDDPPPLGGPSSFSAGSSS